MELKGFESNVAEICFLGALVDIMKYHKKQVTEAKILGLSTGIQMRYKFLGPESNEKIWVDCINPILDFEAMKEACAYFDMELTRRIIKDKATYIAELKKQLALGRPCIVEVKTSYLTYYPETVAQNNIHNITVYGLDETTDKVYVADNYLPNLSKGIFQGEISLKEFREALIIDGVDYQESMIYFLEDGVKTLSEDEKIAKGQVLKNQMLLESKDAYLRGYKALEALEEVFLTLTTEEAIQQNKEVLQNLYIQLMARGGTVPTRKLYAQYLKEEIGSPCYEEFERLAKEWKTLCTTLIKASKTCNIKVIERIISRFRNIMQLEKELAVKLNQKVLIISPHPDDACFSLGGSICKAKGMQVYIWDLFNVQDYTLLGEDSEAAKKRIMVEEMSFLKETGAIGIFENLPEAALRGYKGLKEILFKDLSRLMADKQNDELYKLIRKRIRALIEEIEPTWIGIPLGCGGHIDHILVRDGVLNELDKMEHIHLFLYEELPYALNQRWVKKAKENKVYEAHQLEEKLLDITGYVEEKEKLLKIYKSQLEESECQDIKDYAFQIVEGKQVERIWIYK